MSKRTHCEESLRRLWLDRPLDQRTPADVAVFHAMIQQRHYALLEGITSKRGDDSLEQLTDVLRWHTHPPP